MIKEDGHMWKRLPSEQSNSNFLEIVGAKRIDAIQQYYSLFYIQCMLDILDSFLKCEDHVINQEDACELCSQSWWLTTL